jgi:hypothetical protein
MLSFTKKYNISKDTELDLAQKLTVITARSYIFNRLVNNDFYIPPVVYTDTSNPYSTLTASSILLLRMIIRIPPTHGTLRVIPFRDGT